MDFLGISVAKSEQDTGSLGWDAPCHFTTCKVFQSSRCGGFFLAINYILEKGAGEGFSNDVDLLSADLSALAHSELHKDLSAEQIAMIYKLRWDIEKFFGWWKGHLKVYHLIARSRYGVLVQILAGLITYLLLAIYCHEHYIENTTMQHPGLPPE